MYQLILESGCRTTELKEFIINFDSKKVEIVDGIVVYRNFYLRKSKNSYYLFFTKKTFDEFLSLDLKWSNTIFNRFKENIFRNKNIINIKYFNVIIVNKLYK